VARPKIPEDEILDRVAEVFAEVGYERATTQRLAKAAGVAETTLFRRFGSKAELFARALASDVEALAAAGHPSPTADLRADLVRLVQGYQQMWARRGALLPVLFREAQYLQELSVATELPSGMVERAMGIIQHHQDRGALIGATPAQCVTALLAPFLVVGLMASLPLRVTPATLDPEEHVDRFLSGWRA